MPDEICFYVRPVHLLSCFIIAVMKTEKKNDAAKCYVRLQGGPGSLLNVTTLPGLYFHIITISVIS